jgi:hypothetical protein
LSPVRCRRIHFGAAFLRDLIPRDLIWLQRNSTSHAGEHDALPRKNCGMRGIKMKLRLVLGGIAVLLVGCAADTMRSYLGQDIRNVELTYGPPANQIELGNGVRAFQWRKISVDTTPMSAVTTTDKDRKGRKTTETQFVGGQQSVTDCLYTFLTTWDARQNGWIVTGIRQPSFDCAIGDLS